MTWTAGPITGLPDPDTFELDDEYVLTIDGRLDASNAAEGIAWRQQLLGLEMLREVVITWSEDATVDGVYTDVEVALENTEVSLSEGVFEFTLTARRLPAYQTGKQESDMIGYLRTNSHSIGTGTITPWIGLPESIGQYNRSGGTDTFDERYGDSALGSTAGGTVRVWTPGTAMTETVEWQIDPADYWDMAPQLTVGGTLVVGDMIENNPTSWVLNNGLIKIEPNDSTTLLKISCYDGTQWETAKTVEVGYWNGSVPFVGGGSWVEPSTAAESLEVLHWGPEMIAIRLTFGWEPSTGLNLTATVDLALRRGARLVRGVTKSDYADYWGLKLSDMATNSTLTLGGGVRRSSDDSDGNQLIALTPLSFSDNVDGTRTQFVADAQVNVFPFGLGFVVTAASASAPDDADSLETQYFALQAETQRSRRG